MDSSPLLQYVTFSCVFHNAQAVFGLWQETGSYTIRQTCSLYTVKLWLCGLLVLSTRMYACIDQKYSVPKVLFSLLILMYWPSKTSTKWNILSLLVYKQAIRQNISLWEGVLVLEGQYIHTSRENKTFDTEYFWPIHTYIRAKREAVDFMPFNC